MSEYSDLKPAWHVDRIMEMREGNLILPSQVQLIMSDLCNHDCVFCAYRMSGGNSTEQFADENGNKNPQRFIPTKKCREILDDIAELGIGAVQFTGGGEPTVHSDHLDIIEHAMLNGLRASLVTNGAIFRDGWERVFPNLSWFRVSLDAGSPKTYAAVRKVKESTMNKVLCNLEKMSRAVEKSNSQCVVGVSYVVTRDNWHEIPTAAWLAENAGAKYIRFGAVFGAEGSEYYNGVYDGILDKLQQAREERVGFRIVDMFGKRLEDLNSGRPDYSFCGYQQFNVYVAGNQKVYRCCTTSYTKRGEVGDLSEQRFIDWYYSQQRELSYSKFSARTCKQCPFNGKNKVIGYMVDPEPTHVEFV